jgi:hypothetical protein
MQVIRQTGSAIGLVVAMSAGSAVAQSNVSTRPSTFGASQVAHAIQAHAFEAISVSNGQLHSNAFGSRYCTDPSGCIVAAAVTLPAGAIIDSIVLDGCDDSAANDLQLNLVRAASGEGSSSVMATAGTTGTPGCAPLVGTPTAHAIDNLASFYRVEVGLPGGVGEPLRFQGVRVTYRLQVSPAPGVATFPNDVPTSHPFFQFVEALAAAGITAGIAPGTFGVNDPITRGQIAVFLSVALGLHWAP